MSRKLRTHLPIVPSKLSEIVNSRLSIKNEERRKEKQRVNYNKKHRARDLSEFTPSDAVWVTDLRAYGKIVRPTGEPRSYLVETDRGMFRRNRWHLINAPYCNSSKIETTSHAPVDSSAEECNSNKELEELTENTVKESEVQERVRENSPVRVEDKPGSSLVSRPVRKCNKPAWFADYVI